MVERYQDWLRQANKDLKHAKNSIKNGDYEWACFACHQAAEKAVKALFQNVNGEVWGHSVTYMLGKLPDAVKSDNELIDKAKELDKHYIPSRCPNGFFEGAPMDYYTKEDAERSVKICEEIVKFCESKIRK